MNEEYFCPVYKRCGGCQLQNMSYGEQLRYKQGKVIALIGKYCHVDDIVGMDDPTHYRCKVQAAFGRGRNGIISGVYQSSSHRIVPIDSCLIENETADRIIVTVRKLMEHFKIKPYDEERRQGCVRHVLVRCGCFSKQIMVVIVTGSREIPSKSAFIKELIRRCPEITTVVHNINGKFTSLVLGSENETLYGAGYIEDSILGMSFRISPASFYQINPVVTEKLYGAAIDSLSLTGRERVIDAYCGTGTIGLIASRSAKEVLGVELNKDAVIDARKNAKDNGVTNIRFVKADASEFLDGMAAAGESADALIMDPPRAGSTVRFMSAAVKMAPKKIVYVSCNPETLARDLGFLTSHGYKAELARPFDMFPFTVHVETVCLLTIDK